MRRNLTAPEGALHRLALDSVVLAGNPLGDATRRRIDVYVPAGHDGRGLPLLIDLVGFTAGGPAHTNWRNFTENVPEQLDRLIHTGAMKPAAVAFPDCFTKLGGNQYINSAGTGRWADFLIQEAVPFVESRFGCGGQGKRGVFGKSSGGYGAMVHALFYPHFWSAAACHSGDMGWDMLQLPEMPRVLRALAKEGGSIQRWLNAFFAKKKAKDDDIHILMMLCMCATYDPDAGAYMGVRLPVTSETCEIIPERWANWMAWDPLEIARKRAAGLKTLKLLYLDCGDIDQYNLVYGARRMNRLLSQLGIAHIYEEFPDDHTGIDYRMDRSLPLLAAALSA